MHCEGLKGCNDIVGYIMKVQVNCQTLIAVNTPKEQSRQFDIMKTTK